MEDGVDSEPAMWSSCVILVTCHGSLGSRSLECSFISLISFRKCVFFIMLVKAKFQEAMLNGCSYFCKTQNEIYLPSQRTGIQY